MATRTSVRLKVPAGFTRKPKATKEVRCAPPLYQPHPDSLLPLRRCFRADCRTVKPSGCAKCPRCGALIDTSTPLCKWTVYVEQCESTKGKRNGTRQPT